MLSYEKLDVYQCSIQFLAEAMKLISSTPRGYASIADQLKRAAISIPLNIAESSGKRTKPDCSRFLYIARGSAMECAAAVDVYKELKLVDQITYKKAKDLLKRIVSMLTKMAI